MSGHCAGPAYPSVVIEAGPLAYYRFNDSTNRPNINVNSGSLGAAGNATNLNTHLVNDGAVAGSYEPATYFDTTAVTMVPWNAALNPNASNDFTVEGWFKPTTDGTFGNFAGPSPIMNRFSPGVAPYTNRQGWVFFQRSPDSSYSNPDGVGWTFRTYTGVNEDVGVQITSQVPYRLGEWQYVAVVWSGAAQSATMYINGTNVVTGTNTSSDPNAYAANTDQPGAPTGSAGFAIGEYNNTGASQDPFSGAIDEVAFYSTQLTPLQILAHYQNATNASRTVAYNTLVESDGPVGYWQLDDLPAATNDMAINEGTLQASGDATNLGGVRHPTPDPLATGNSSGSGYHYRHGQATTDQGWMAANNPPASVPFTFEAWARPLWDEVNNGQALINNRYENSGNRTGWVIYQRGPNDTYTGGPGVGWTFRMYTGTGSGGQDILTGQPYNVGDWQHLVFTWQPVTDQGAATGNGDDFWQGIQTAYVDGIPVATNPQALYCGNTDPTDNGTMPADFGIGSYNAASGFGEGFEGEIANVAFYSNYILTTNQIMAHYQAGTNSHPATNYETLVLTAAYDGAGTQGLQPASFFRLNEPAYFPAANSGTLGVTALGSLVDTTNDVPGPITTGFELTNLAVPVGQTAGWVSLNSPAGLNFSNQLTLEAWILPDASQTNNQADIISYGPPIPSALAPGSVTLTGIDLDSNQIFLSITNSAADYAFGYFDGTNYHGVSYPVGSDLTSGQWIYLAGTYNGTTWSLYRNGVDVTNSIDVVAALPVLGSEWAIGSEAEGWTNYFQGSIDEVAIYNKALSAATINAHYFVAESGSGSLTIAASGSNVIITWSMGTLQSADSLAGPWTDVPAATSPYQTSSSSGTLFYRVKL